MYFLIIILPLVLTFFSGVLGYNSGAPPLFATYIICIVSSLGFAFEGVFGQLSVWEAICGIFNIIYSYLWVCNAFIESASEFLKVYQNYALYLANKAILKDDIHNWLPVDAITLHSNLQLIPSIEISLPKHINEDSKVLSSKIDSNSKGKEALYKGLFLLGSATLMLITLVSRLTKP